MKGAGPGILNVIVCGPGVEFAVVIAVRSDPGPLSFVFVTRNGFRTLNELLVAPLSNDDEAVNV